METMETGRENSMGMVCTRGEAGMEMMGMVWMGEVTGMGILGTFTAK